MQHQEQRKSRMARGKNSSSSLWFTLLWSMSTCYTGLLPISMITWNSDVDLELHNTYWKHSKLPLMPTSNVFFWYLRCQSSWGVLRGGYVVTKENIQEWNLTLICGVTAVLSKSIPVKYFPDIMESLLQNNFDFGVFRGAGGHGGGGKLVLFRSSVCY